MFPFSRHTLCVFAAAALAYAWAALPVRAADITVFAAASLQNALSPIAEAFTQETDLSVQVAYAGSSAIARQVDFAAPADVVLLASADWMDWLQEQGRIVEGSRLDLLGNRLVVIAPSDDAAPLDVTSPEAIKARLGSGRLATALVDAVPAGIYAREALTALGLWPDLAPQTAQADNVRAALALVAIGEVPLGIVYQTDADADDRVAVVANIAPSMHSAIVYPAAAVAGGQEALAARFIDYLTDQDAAAVFRAEGFEVLAGE